MEIPAPSHWRRVEFISDLHLHGAGPKTFSAWREYLLHANADAVFILGDLFEVWVGDDAANIPLSFEQQCVEVLRASAARRPLYLMRGNRDFLMGPTLAAAAHCTLLEDPTVLVFGGERWLLSHADDLCLDDTAYMAFRATVRTIEWQTEFLAKPLNERIDIARSIRAQSEARKQTTVTYADVDSTAAIALLNQTNTTTLIHGHTHRPQTHALAHGLQRVVLSDWDLDAAPQRAEVLRLTIGSAGNNIVLDRVRPVSVSPTPAD
jgi:UDP-2,3-diacylglucosamine hydrolase